jgi:peptidoglycan/xylan/chitin deacetylase (PgdA/CDA1 family)
MNLQQLVQQGLSLLVPQKWWIYRGSEPSVYLTYDDGPHPEITPKVLDLLKTYNAKASFFLVGEEIAKYPALALRIAQEGHAIGNHSYWHRSFHTMPLKKQQEEITQTNKLIRDTVGIHCSLFRAPGGRWALSLLHAVIRQGMTAVHWNRNSLDYLYDEVGVTTYLAQQPLKSGDVVLLHDDHAKVLGITRYILETYKQSRFAALTAHTE